MRNPAGHVAREALGVGEHGVPADPPTPVVRDQSRLLDLERVEQRDHVGGDRRLAVVAVGRLARPPEPAQVHGEDTELAGEALDHPPPHVPVLREPVQRDQRRLGLVPRVGDVGADTGREVVVAVGDAGQFGRVHPDGVPAERPGRFKSAASTAELGNKAKLNVENAKAVGKKIAEKALASGIKSIVFDRGGYLYHGNVKALAEGAREGGLKF